MILILKELQSHVNYDNQSLRMKRQPKDYHLQTLCAFVELNGLIIYAVNTFIILVCEIVDIVIAKREMEGRGTEGYCALFSFPPPRCQPGSG